MSPAHLPGAHHVARTMSRNSQQQQPPEPENRLNGTASFDPPHQVSANDARPRSSSPSSSSSSSNPNEPQDFTREDTEWQDVDPEDNADGALSFRSLCDERTFGSLEEMVDHDKSEHGVDLKDLVERFGLDFYGAIKLVNYIRSSVQAGSGKPALDSQSDWEHEKFLQPVLEDDAVLFSLDELVASAAAQELDTAGQAANGAQEGGDADVNSLKVQLNELQQQFADYRTAVEQTLEQRWSDTKASGAGSAAGPSRLPAGGRDKPERLNSVGDVEERTRKEDDEYYFESYAYNDIHETMLRDTVRTNAYRDFIYDHKDLFAAKTVLDVGTGTGILSMFAAKAGASRVWAVDNSNVIEKARMVVKENGLEKTVKCVRGRVEEVGLEHDDSTPSVADGLLNNGEVVKGKTAAFSSAGGKVDILISEWMGYALLYESMLDSVLHARDRFLKPDGLMAPSHTTLRIAPFSDPDYIVDNFHFWDSVYGFDMRAMSGGMYDEVMVRSVKPDNVVGQPSTFRTLDLHNVKTEDLEFQGASFETPVDRDLEDGLDGFIIWFDAFFLTSRDAQLQSDATAGAGLGAEAWPGKSNEDKGLSFTTGPWGKETHWRSGCCVIDKSHAKPVPLGEGSIVNGTVDYKKRTANNRQLDIKIKWTVFDNKGEMKEERRQTWSLR